LQKKEQWLRLIILVTFDAVANLAHSSGVSLLQIAKKVDATLVNQPYWLT